MRDRIARPAIVSPDHVVQRCAGWKVGVGAGRLWGALRRSMMGVALPRSPHTDLRFVTNTHELLDIWRPLHEGSLTQRYGELNIPLRHLIFCVGLIGTYVIEKYHSIAFGLAVLCSRALIGW